MEMTFEKAMARLQKISELMENPEMPLDEALKLYSEATELTGFCKGEIDTAKLKLEKADNA